MGSGYEEEKGEEGGDDGVHVVDKWNCVYGVLLYGLRFIGWRSRDCELFDCTILEIMMTDRAVLRQDLIPLFHAWADVC